MANYVDELRLGIKVEDNKSGEKVRSLANAISRLNRVIAQLDPALLKSTFGVLRKEMGGLAKEAKSAEKALVAAANVLRGGGIAKAVKEAQAASAQIQPVIQSVQSEADIAHQEKLKFLKAENERIEQRALSMMKEKASGAKYYENLAHERLSLLKNENLTAEERAKIEREIYEYAKKANRAKKSSLLQEFIRVDKYRIIRTIINQLEQGIAAMGGTPQTSSFGSSTASEDDVNKQHDYDEDEKDNYELQSLTENSEESREAMLKKEIRDFSKTNPEIVAQLIRTWLR